MNNCTSKETSGGEDAFNCKQYVLDNYGEEIIDMFVEEYGIESTLYLYSLTQDEVDEVLAKY